jgi:hypothetical protein
LNSPQHYESQLGTGIPSQIENQHLQPPATCISLLIHAHCPTIRKTPRIRVLLQGLEDGPYDCDSDEGTAWFCGLEIAFCQLFWHLRYLRSTASHIVSSSCGQQNGQELFKILVPYGPLAYWILCCMAERNLGLPAEHGVNNQQKEVFMIPAGWKRKSTRWTVSSQGRSGTPPSFRTIFRAQLGDVPHRNSHLHGSFFMLFLFLSPYLYHPSLHRSGDLQRQESTMSTWIPLFQCFLGSVYESHRPLGHIARCTFLWVCRHGSKVSRRKKQPVNLWMSGPTNCDHLKQST